MAQKVTNTTFNINVPSTSLDVGDKLIFKFQMNGNTISNFTASIGQGNLKVNSLAASAGSTSTPLQFFSGSGTISANEIVMSTGVSGFYGGQYTFVPNPLTGSINSLYAGTANYGDVDYPFLIQPFDVALIYLSDGTYIETRILKADTNSGKLVLTLDTSLSNTIRQELQYKTYTRFLILSRRQDETNVILSFTKREGKTSYGFLIPENASPDVLDNIDAITSQSKQKLLNDQSVISDINGGTFGP
jgi:cold shock CspA family protein